MEFNLSENEINFGFLEKTPLYPHNILLYIYLQYVSDIISYKFKIRLYKLYLTCFIQII